MSDFDCACVEYHPDFLDAVEAGACLQRLWRNLAWEQREITLFGRRVLQPRLTAWYGDEQAVYSYSGLRLHPRPWHELLVGLKTRIERFTAAQFNSVLANAYRDGADSMGWHSDDEPELGEQPVIASLSLGAARRFLLRENRRLPDHRRKSLGLMLEHGSLLLMKAECQRGFQHSVPRTRRPTGLRINLTYRLICAQAPD